MHDIGPSHAAGRLDDARCLSLSEIRMASHNRTTSSRRLTADVLRLWKEDIEPAEIQRRGNALLRVS
jgi:hypothetical protein